MKHLTHTHENILQDTGKKSFSQKVIITLLRVMIPILLVALFAGKSTAQCTLVCNGTLESPLQASVGNTCMLPITNDMILEDMAACPGDKTIQVRNDQNTLLASGTNEAVLDASTLIGEILSVTITDVETGVTCSGFIELMDFIDPVFEGGCEDINVSCVANTSPDSLGYPIVTDNCGDVSDIELDYEDIITDGNCLVDTLLYIDRVWTATDGSGNEASCTQHIRVIRPSMDEIEYPEDITLSCDNPDASMEITGAPSVGGVNIMYGNGCGLGTNFVADTVALCGDIEYQIIRTWTILEQCTGFVSTDVQVISIMDETAPEIQCSNNFTTDADPGECTATIVLPIPVITDNCDAEPTFTVTTSLGGEGLGPHTNVPQGTHTATYTAIDQCGNQSTCTMEFTVIDDQIPSVTCNEELIVSINNTGIGILPAEAIDEGSVDNCNEQLYFKAVRNIVEACGALNGDDSDIDGYQEWYDDEIAFCCEEVGQTIDITLRVYEIDPGDGPVAPERHLPGGDLFGHFNDCISTVTVYDNIGPYTVSCPENVTIECGDDYSDLSQFGSPEFFDNCSYTVDSIAVESISECGVGQITRTWTVTDNIGLSQTCSQVITIVNNSPFNEDDITWPPNYVTYECGADVAPENLPEEYQFPSFESDECSQIFTNYNDDLYWIAYPGCYKILRTWSIMDGCVFDPENDDQTGMYTYIQTIKVLDGEAPVIQTTLDNIVAPVENNCEQAVVTMESVIATDCHPSVTITNDSPYATNGGANASGTYPLGTTVVTFTASDNCGNTSTTSVEVTVEDQTGPGPICITGISVELMNVDGVPTATVPVSAFDAGVVDNCTPEAAILKTIRVGQGDGTVPLDTEVQVSCDMEGIQVVEYWATDAVGNSDYCVTYVDIQDNMNLCETQTTSLSMIAGGISNEMGEMIEGVYVQVVDNEELNVMTDVNGHFEFADVPSGETYAIEASLNDNITNGISTFDIILMQKHILGEAYLNSPYKMIAADINRSGSISTFDVVKLRRIILGLDTEMPSGNTSWRFIDADYEFMDPTNPFDEEFEELVNLSDLQGDEMYADFIAVKVGDVNNSAVPNSLATVQERAEAGQFDLAVQDRELESGTTYTIDFLGRDMDRLEGFQFTLHFDDTAIELLDISGAELPNITAANFNQILDGTVVGSWNAAGEKPSNEEQVLFSLTFESYADINLSDIMWIDSKVLRAEAYTTMNDELNLGLVFLEGETTTASDNELYQNRPNPFSDDTIIGFKLSEQENVRFTVYSMAGRVLYSMESVFDAGYNEILVGKSDLNTTGVMYYQIEAGDWNDTRKMILSEE